MAAATDASLAVLKVFSLVAWTVVNSVGGMAAYLAVDLEFCWVDS